MHKKHLSIILALLFMFAGNLATAQVYTINAKYSLLSIYSGEYHNLWFDRIDTSNNYTLIADFDKKIINDPTDSYSPLTVTDIVNVGETEAGSKFYILKVKPDKWVKWRYYKLMINRDNIPIYIQETDQQKGRDQKRDTFFNTYTNNLATLSFHKKTARIKDMPRNEDRLASYNLLSDLWKEKWKVADNIVEMRDGYINWTGGGETHHLLITEVHLLKIEGTDGIRLICSEKDGELYDICYTNSDQRIEENQHGKEQFITIAKIVGDKRVWEAILL